MSPPTEPRCTCSRVSPRVRWKPQGLRNRRGVSEIIATIYVVAITVALAGVLFVEVSSVTQSRASPPYAVEMVFSTQTQGVRTYFDFGTLVTTSGLMTSMFGLKVATPQGATYGTAAVVPGTCAYGAANPSPTTCPGVPDGWYGILLSGMNSTVTAMYSAVGWTYGSGTTSFALNDGCTLIVVTSSPVAGSDMISAFGTGSSSVSGSASL